MLLHTDTFTHRGFYTQTLFYTDESVAMDASKSQFFLSF